MFFTISFPGARPKDQGLTFRHILLFGEDRKGAFSQVLQLLFLWPGEEAWPSCMPFLSLCEIRNRHRVLLLQEAQSKPSSTLWYSISAVPEWNFSGSGLAQKRVTVTCKVSWTSVPTSGELMRGEQVWVQLRSGFLQGCLSNLLPPCSGSYQQVNLGLCPLWIPRQREQY